MPDPFSIGTGLIGLLASIVNVSLKLNDLRRSFLEAGTEIDSCLHQLSDLSKVLTRLQESDGLLRLPDGLSHDLLGVLKNCTAAARKTEAVLLDSYLKPFRKLYWACTGKNEVLQLRQELEAHKTTINIILTMSLTMSTQQPSREIMNKMDQVLSAIKYTHRLLTEKDIVLRRFLEDAESYAGSRYEQSSATCVDDQFYQYQNNNVENEIYDPGCSKEKSTSAKIDKVHFDTSPPLWQHQAFPSTNTKSYGSSTTPEKKSMTGRYRFLRTLPDHSSGISSVAFSKSGRQLVSGAWDGTLRMWDLETHSNSRSMHGHSDDVTSVAFVGDESCLASASSDMTIRLWDIETGSTLQELHGHRDRISSLAWSSSSGQLASGSGDATIRLWDIGTGLNSQVFQGNCGGVWSIALTDDGRQLVSGSGDGMISIWDVRIKRIVQSLRGHDDGVWSLSLSRDMLVSGSWDRTAMLWDLRKASATQILTGHDERITSVVFLDEGLLASGSGDEKMIKLWDIVTGSVVQTLEVDGGGISSLAFSASNGAHLASGSGDRTIRLWEKTFDPR